MNPNKKTTINPEGLMNAPRFGYSHAARVGDTVYCAGQVSGADTLEKQAQEALSNVRVLLSHAGAQVADIVKVTIYSTEEDCWERTADIRREFFLPPFPPITMMVVKALATPPLKIEVDVTAVVGCG
ncbi:MAG TPA: RidA family protein [Dehalococcoidia bacterium]|nr:RidA family protein [Dehalococcoidia bacterium]